MEESKWTYFQYFKELGYQSYIRVNLEDFDTSLPGLLTQMNFIQLTPEEADEFEQGKSSDKKYHILTIEEASAPVSRQIDSSIESDYYGPESIVPKSGYQVYRYRGEALIVYSLAAKEWRMGCYPDFGAEDKKMAHRSIINRYLSWSLAHSGVVGFWGVPVDEGVVVLKQAESMGEAVFIDTAKRKVLTIDGEKRMRGHFTIMRLDSGLSGRNLMMSSEELLSFLSLHCTYFEYDGMIRAVRQMVQEISKTSSGIVHPKESFKPRTDLAL
jgi:hypothetical protein